MRTAARVIARKCCRGVVWSFCALWLCRPVALWPCGPVALSPCRPVALGERVWSACRSLVWCSNPFDVIPCHATAMLLVLWRWRAGKGAFNPLRAGGMLPNRCTVFLNRYHSATAVEIPVDAGGAGQWALRWRCSTHPYVGGGSRPLMTPGATRHRDAGRQAAASRQPVHIRGDATGVLSVGARG